MLHVGIACNLLAAIGGQPMILRAASRYPAQLPKDIHAGLSVALAPLTPELVLKTFMAIEEPAAHLVDDPDFTPSGSLLIGQFYGALLQTFEALSPPISATGQVDMSGLFSSFNVHAPFGVSFIIGSLDDVRAGIGPRSQTQPDEPVQLHRTRGHDAARASGVAG